MLHVYFNINARAAYITALVVAYIVVMCGLFGAFR